MLPALYQMRRLWENEVQKQSTYSALYFVFCFNTLSGKRDINMKAIHLEHPAHKSTYGNISKHHMMMSHHDVM